MRGYAEREVFSQRELELLSRATALVRRMPHEFEGQEIRCHELARIVRAFLALPVADGFYGVGVEHSWIWTDAPALEPHRWDLPNILDVYVPGQLPQVQLIHTATALPLNYRLGAPMPMDDVRWRVVEHFVEELREKA